MKGRMIQGLVAVTLAASLAAGAAAQTPLPTETVAPEDRRMFRLCRAAIFFHLAEDARRETLPRVFAETLLEQINLIMFETLRSAPAATVAESRKALDFVEQFFLSFSRTIAENRALLEDPAEREPILIECQSFVWPIVRARIDYLFRWRERAVDAPPMTEPVTRFGVGESQRP
jgi:hypothetical protein